MHDAALAAIIGEQQKKCDKTYGYRRMWKWLKCQKKICKIRKQFCALWRKYELLSEIRRRRKWKQMGQQVHKYENLLNRGISGWSPQSQVGHGHLLHSHRSRRALSVYHSRSVWQQYCCLQDRNYTDRQSCTGHHPACDAEGESRCGSCSSTATKAVSTPPKHTLTWLENTALRRPCQDEETATTTLWRENFFSILKTECIYRHHAATFEDARSLIDNYVPFLQLPVHPTWNWVAPLTLRHSGLKFLSFPTGAFCAVRTIWQTVQ